MTDVIQTVEPVNPRSTFSFDEKTLNLIDRLKGDLSVSTRVEVIRRALALLITAVECSQDKVVVVETAGGRMRILLGSL
jgi:hypothetical protein